MDTRTGTVRQNQISREYKGKIMRVFLDALYVFLDGEVHLASEEGAPNNVNPSSPVKAGFGGKSGSGFGVAFPTIGGGSTGIGGGSVLIGGVGEGDVDVEAIDIRDTVRSSFEFQSYLFRL